MKNIHVELHKLGLGTNEALVYEALLHSSPASASFIAKKCSLSRSSVYTSLSALISKGLVGTTYKNDVKQFVVEDLEAVEQLIEKEKSALEDKVMALKSLIKYRSLLESASLNIPSVAFFEGQEGLKKVYLSMMRNAQPGATMYLLRDEFVWDEEWQFIFKKEWHDRVKRYKTEKNITTKLLINDSRKERSVSLYKTRKGLNYRFLPKRHSVEKFAMYIMDDMVSILSIERNNLVGIQIMNKHLAENFKVIFEGLWSKSR